MKIQNTIQLPNGVVKFNGELNPDEANTVIETGLACLVMAGFFPDITKAFKDAEEGVGLVVDGPDTVQ